MVEEFAEGFKTKTAADFFSRNGSVSSGSASRFGNTTLKDINFTVGKLGGGGFGNYLYAAASGQNNNIKEHAPGYMQVMSNAMSDSSFYTTSLDTLDTLVKTYFN